jgi:drug/metabolite transporter (DMT)-like permease
LSKKPVVLVIGSAVLFGLGTPLSKLLLNDIPPVALAGLLYAGAFLGLAVYRLAAGIFRRPPASQQRLRGNDWVWLAGATVAGGIVGPICLLFGLAKVAGYAASLLLNLEGAATALIAVVLFREHAGRRVWLALACMTAAGIFLSWDPGRGRFTAAGSVLIVAAMVAWGLDNNFTRNISDKDPAQIARIKGLVAGAFSLSLAVVLGWAIRWDRTLAYGLILGALSYGASLVLYIQALRGLGAFRAGAFFSVAPFIGALGSLLILPEPSRWTLWPGVLAMALGVVLIVEERHSHRHVHETLTHGHPHSHQDGHHAHKHAGNNVSEPHAHEHTHEPVDHSHVHWPDIHHRHGHK